MGIALVKGVFLYAQRWILIGISREIEFDLRNDLFIHLEKQDSGFYQQYRTGDIMARMTNDLNAVRILLGPALMYSANTVFFTVGALFFLLRISPYLTLVALAPMPMASILVQYFGTTHPRPIRAHPGQLLRDLRAGSGELLRRAAGPRLCPRRIADRPLRKTQSRVHRPRAAPGSAHGHALAHAGIHSRRLDGDHAAGRRPPGARASHHAWAQFVAFNTYMVMLIWPIIAVGWVVNLFQRGTASVMRIDELLKAEPAIDDSAADPAIPADTTLRGEIEFRHLNFSYGDTPVLRDISLHVPAGSSLAIVGPTGSGKTTLVNLLSRLFEAPDGSLLIDGRPVRDYPLATLRGNIGMVPQETFLFSETIRENLTFGAPNATADELTRSN